jgi:drug/metabolite transporter (DMT)-like permease
MLSEIADWQLTGLVLLAAVVHASWNAIAKSSSDPLLNVTVITSAGGIVSACALPFLPFPEPAAWPFLAVSVVLHLIYQLLLVWSYTIGDLSQVYPIARGLAPLGVTALAALAAREIPSGSQAIGLVIASAAIMSLSLVGRSGPASRAAVRAALLTAVLITSYTVVDGLGARVSGGAIGFVAWMSVLDFFPMLIVALILRRGRVLAFLRAEGPRASAAGVLAILGYGTVVFAMSKGAMGPVSALRETSVVIAAFIGTRLMGEPFGRARVAASAVLVLGLLLGRI